MNECTALAIQIYRFDPVFRTFVRKLLIEGQVAYRTVVTAVAVCLRTILFMRCHHHFSQMTGLVRHSIWKNTKKFVKAKKKKNRPGVPYLEAQRNNSPYATGAQLT